MASYGSSVFAYCFGDFRARIRQGTTVPQRLMRSRSLALLALPLLILASCKSPYKESDAKREAQKKNASNDPTFQAFLGRLRIAVAKKDYEVLRGMMVPDFGYRWDNPPPGDSIFAYWDLNNLWPELEKLLQTQFMPLEDFMVSPPEFADKPSGYAGYRVGIKQIMGSWRFVYFVPPPPPEQTPAPTGQE
jgi:hypothetical protein